MTVIEAPIIDGIQWDDQWSAWYVWGLGFSEMCGDVFRVSWNGQLADCSCIGNLKFDSFMAHCAGMDDPGRIELLLVDPSAPGNRDLWRVGPSRAIGLNPYHELSISNVRPSSGYIGDVVTVIGDHFNPYPEDMTITFFDSEGNSTGVSINPMSVTQVPADPGGPDWLTFKVPEELRGREEQSLTFRLGLTNLAVGYGQSWDSDVFALKKAESAAWGDQDLIAFGESHGYIRSTLVGDITGDGINDLIVGVSQEQSGSGKYMGAVYIVFGPVSGVSLPTGQQYMDLTIDATDIHWDVVISGDYTACYAQDSKFCQRIGNSLAIGDINGDGINDLLVGSTDLNEEGVHLLNPDTFQDTYPAAGNKGHLGGRAYIYYGRPIEQWHCWYDIPYGEYDVIIQGDYYRELGYQVAVANLNGDSYADIMISAPSRPYDPVHPDLDWSGRVYIIFGSSALPQDVNVDNIPTSVNGVVIAGESEWQRILTTEYKGDGLGQGIAVGDVNGDGLDDLLVGAPRYYVMYFVSGEGSQVRKGAAFLFYGRSNFGGDDGYLNATSDAGDQDLLILGPKITESPDDFSPGWEIGRVMLIKDLNNDGKGELMLASPHEFLRYGDTQSEETRGHIGLVYLLSGESVPQSGIYGVNQLARAKIYGSTAISRFGASLATADVNNDSYKDLLVGAPGRIGGASGKIGEEDPGQVWGFYGSNNLPSGVIHLIDRSATSGVFPDDFLIKGDQAHPGKRYGFGTFVTAGDLNPFEGDDVLIIDPLAKAPESSAPGTWRDYSGMLYVFYEGSQGLWPVTIYPERVTLNACNDQQLFLAYGGKEPYMFVWDTANVPEQVELGYEYGDTSAMVRIHGCLPGDFDSLRLRVYDGDASTYEDVVAAITFVHQPDISVQPSSIEFPEVPLGNIASHEIEIRNNGSADLHIGEISIGGLRPDNFTERNTCPEALSPGAGCTVTVTFDPVNLVDVMLYATLSIASDDPDEPLLLVDLSGYGVRPALSLDPESLEMGGDKTQAYLTVINTADRCIPSLDWEITPNLPPWLSVSPMSGNISCGGTQTVSIQVNRDGLPAGEYSHTLSVISNSGSEDLEVIMSVPSFISVNPVLVGFAEAKKRVTFTIQNTSLFNTPLAWNFTGDFPSWLTASHSGGTIPPGQTASIHLYADRTGLDIDHTYAHSIFMTSTGGDISLEISMSVPVPLATFANTYGGDGGEYISVVRQTSDGGFIAAGLTNSFGAGNEDAWVLKLDPSGYVEWERTYGGGDAERAYDIWETSDGGSIVAGGTWSFRLKWYALWIVKLDFYGDVEWQKEFEGCADDNGGTWGKNFSIRQTPDKGYIVAGNTRDLPGNHCSGTSVSGSSDLWVLKLDSGGNIEWQKTYGSSGEDYANSIQATLDEGFIVAGATKSFGAGEEDIWVLKLDATGDVQWEKTYGGFSYDYAYEILQTPDKGFVLVGATFSFGGAWVLKLDSSGNVEWQKAYGGWDGRGHSITQASDGGYILAGTFFRPGQGDDIWVVKLDPFGQIEWQKACGGARIDVAYSLEQTPEEDYVVAGYTNSFRTTNSNSPNYDAFVLKIDSIGNIGSSCGLPDLTTIAPVETDATGMDTSVALGDSATGVYNTSAAVLDSSAVTETICSETLEEADQRPAFAITVYPINYDFGSVPIGVTAEHSFIVQNSGYEPLTILGISLSGSTDFGVTSTCPDVLGIARQCEITVSFSPSATDPQTAFLWIESNDPDESWIEIHLAGSGRGPGDGEIGGGGETPPPGGVPIGP